MTTYGCGLYAPAPKRWLPARRAALAGEWRVGDLEPAGLHFVLRVPRNTTLVQKQRLRKCEGPENKSLPLPRFRMARQAAHCRPISLSAGLAGIIFRFAPEQLSVFQIPESHGISIWIKRDGVERTKVCAPSRT